MGVAVHNPSNIDIAVQRFAVPSGNYQVQGFNTKSQAFEDAKSTVSCSDDMDELKKPVYSCFLNVEYAVQAHDVGYLQVSMTKKSEHDEMKPIKAGDAITDGEITATFKSAKGNKLVFTVSDPKSSNEEELTFSLSYWLSQVGPHGDNSGDYAFRPVPEMYTPLPYSKFVKGTISNGVQMDFYFEKFDFIENSH